MRLLLLTLLLTNLLLASIGTVMAIRGSADLQRPNLTPTHLTMGTALQEGDSIATQAHSRVQVMLNDQTVVTIGSNSLFTFDRYLFDGTQNSQLAMHAKRGFFRSVSGKIGKIAPKRFSVKTTSATIGIRGTDFSAYLTKDREYYRCFAGEIRVTVGDEAQRLLPGEIFLLQKNLGRVQSKRLLGRGFQTMRPNGVVLERDLQAIDRLIQEEELFTHPTPQGEPCSVVVP